MRSIPKKEFDQEAGFAPHIISLDMHLSAIAVTTNKHSPQLSASIIYGHP